MISSNNRILWKYKEQVNISESLKILFWDEPKKKIPLEKLIKRIFEYGNFEELKKIYSMYPDQCFEFTSRYTETKRGVKYWIRSWHERNN